MHLNLLDVDVHCVMENPLHSIANRNEVTNIFIVPISMEIKARRLIPQLKIYGLHVDENIHSMVEKKEYRLQRRAIDKEMNGDLMDRILCGSDSNSDNNEHKMESYAIIKIIMNGDNYLIQYQCQGYSDEFSFSGDRSYNYHLGFELDKKEMMLLSEKDFNVYCEKQPWKIISRDSCPLCYSISTSWMLYPCKHKFCSSNSCIDGLENNVCIYKFADCRILHEKEAIKGFADDGFCNYDNCMERTVLNRPCGCITCEGDGIVCSRCNKNVTNQIAAK